MREREAYLSAILIGLGIWGGCSRPADPGYYEPLPDKNAAGAKSSSDGGGGTASVQPFTPDASEPAPEPAPAEPQDEDGGSVSNGGFGGEPAPTPSVPDYDPAVIMDDGVLHIWTLGDSITVGVNGGFRNDIYTMLTADGYNVDLVGTQIDDSAEIADQDHEGHTAYTFEKTLEDVDSWLAQIHRPDVVLMLLGANDFAWWTNLVPADHLPVQMEIVDHLLAVLPGAAIVVATLTPQSSEIIESVNLDRTEMVAEYDDLLRAQLPQHPEYGKHVFMADLDAVISLSDLYDGIHPTREAHREIGEVWYQVMKEILPQP